KRLSSTAGRGGLTSSVQPQSSVRTGRRPGPARFRSMSFESANGKAMQSASTEAGKHPFVEPFVEPCVIGRGKIERDVRRTNLNQMEEVSQMKPRAVPMKLRGLISGASLSLILSPVVALGRPVVASAATADPMFQVQVPGVFKQSAFPVDATAGKSVPGVVTLADAESAIAGRGALSASAQGSLGGQGKTVSNHLGNGTLTSSLNREGVFGVESKTLPDASIAFVVPGGFTTDPLTVVIGKPMTLDVSLSVLGGITWDGILTGGDIGSGAANFGHTLSFPSSGPGFCLPSGCTVNSPSGLIVNNQYVTGT